jgi:hypothetical protein
VKVTFLPNVRTVQGISNPYEWSIDVTTALDPRKNSAPLKLTTSIGMPLSARYVFLRSPRPHDTIACVAKAHGRWAVGIVWQLCVVRKIMWSETASASRSSSQFRARETVTLRQ